MSKVTFVNTRFDPAITPFFDLAKQMWVAFSYAAVLQTDKKLAQLLRLSVSQNNECVYCVILNAKASREIGITEAKINNISSWWNSELFTQKEKVALNNCDVLTKGSHKNF